jgi:hypothetical protein
MDGKVMTDPTPEPAPADDPTKAELETLRREKADREKAERDAKDAELEELREFKAKAAKAVPAPVKKADKVPDPDPTPTPGPTTKPKARVSRGWFGDAADD